MQAINKKDGVMLEHGAWALTIIDLQTKSGVGGHTEKTVKDRERKLGTTNVSTCTNTEKRKDLETTQNYSFARLERPLPSISFTATQVTVRSAKGFLSAIRCHTRDNEGVVVECREGSIPFPGGRRRKEEQEGQNRSPTQFICSIRVEKTRERERDKYILLSTSFMAKGRRVGEFRFDVTKRVLI